MVTCDPNVEELHTNSDRLGITAPLATHTICSLLVLAVRRELGSLSIYSERLVAGDLVEAHVRCDKILPRDNGADCIVGEQYGDLLQGLA